MGNLRIEKHMTVVNHLLSESDILTSASQASVYLITLLLHAWLATCCEHPLSVGTNTCCEVK